MEPLKATLQQNRGFDKVTPCHPICSLLLWSSLPLASRNLSSSNFSYHWHKREVSITHLIFADDVFLFRKGNVEFVAALLEGVTCFSIASGLYPNKSKSEVFFGNMACEDKSSILALTGFSKGRLPIRYLGLPLISTKLKLSVCLPLIVTICGKIHNCDFWAMQADYCYFR